MKEGATGRLAWLGPAVISVATALMLWRSWLKWPDSIVDYGQQLYVAWRIGEGQVLYRDMAYFHGPLSSYLQAAVMKLWGTSLLSLVFFNLFVVIILVTLLYQMLSILGSRLAATLACLCFITVFAFSQYLKVGNYNYISPYTSELTHGVFLALLAIFIWLRKPRGDRSSLVGAGLVLGLVFLTKAEVFLAASPALGLGLLAQAWRERWTSGHVARRIAVLVAATTVAPGLTLIAFCLAMPPLEALRGVTGAYVALLTGGNSELLFYRVRMGLDRPLVHLEALVITTFWHLLALAPAVLAAAMARVGKWSHALTLFAVLPLVYVAWHLERVAWLQLARPLPLYMAVLVVVFFRALADQRQGRDTLLGDTLLGGRALGGFTLAAFALILMLKILLNARVYHYGFVLAMPATLLFVLCLVEWLPNWLDHRGGSGRVFRWLATAWLGVAVVAHLQLSERRFQDKQHLVAYGGDAFWSDPRGQALSAALEFFDGRDEPNATLTVVPDGIMLNYLARMPSSMPYLNYVPTEVFAYGEERMIEDWRAHPPDYVAVVDKSTAEFGYHYFGQDYGQDLWRLIQESYEPVVLIGAEPLEGRGFGIKILQRRRSQSSSRGISRGMMSP